MSDGKINMKDTAVCINTIRHTALGMVDGHTAYGKPISITIDMDGKRTTIDTYHVLAIRAFNHAMAIICEL